MAKSATKKARPTNTNTMDVLLINQWHSEDGQSVKLDTAIRLPDVTISRDILDSPEKVLAALQDQGVVPTGMDDIIFVDKQDENTYLVGSEDFFGDRNPILALVDPSTDAFRDNIDEAAEAEYKDGTAEASAMSAEMAAEEEEEEDDCDEQDDLDDCD